MNKLNSSLKSLRACEEVVYELEEINRVLLNACGMFVVWNENSEVAPMFHEVEFAITEAFKMARDEPTSTPESPVKGG